MKIVLGNNQKVEAHYKEFVIKTDQPGSAGGDGEAPSPFDFFLASIGTCAGYYVKSFCQQRDIPEDGIELVQRMHYDQDSRLISSVEIEIGLPSGFPEKYREPLIKAAGACTVKKHIAQAPDFVIHTRYK